MDVQNLIGIGVFALLMAISVFLILLSVLLWKSRNDKDKP